MEERELERVREKREEMNHGGRSIDGEKEKGTSSDVNETLSDRIEWICRSVCNATAWFLLTNDDQN